MTGAQAYNFQNLHIMFLIIINLVIFYCLLGINAYTREFNVEPQTRCGKPFCESFADYPRDNITKLVVGNPGFIKSQKGFEDELTQPKAKKKSLCDCSPRITVPLVGLNVYNAPRFIVNIEEYSQKFLSCSKNLTEIKEFKSTLCYNINPEDDHYRSICLPKYQNVLLNVVKDHQLYLDEFYVIALYKCVLIPK